MRSFLPFLAFLVLAQGVYRNYQNCQLFDQDTQASLHWTLEDGRIRIGMEAKVDNFFAFGISANENLLKSNTEFMDGWVVRFDGECATTGCLFDSFITGDGVVMKDFSSDLEDVFLYRDGDKLVAEFSRRLDTKDAKDHAINLDGQLLFWSTELSSTGVLEMDGSFIINFGDSGYTCEARIFEERQATTATGTAGGVAGGTGTYASGVFSMTYMLDATQTMITFTISAQTTGWVSIGYKTTNGKMMNCDMAVGWVDDNTQNPYLYDVYSTGYTEPADDTTIGGTKDVTLISSSQTGGKTTLTFSRLLVTKDTSGNDIPITVATSNNFFFEWAYGTADGQAGPPLVYGEHPLTATGGGGSFQVNVFTGGIIATPFTLRPGQALLIIIAGLLLIWIIAGSAYRFIKYTLRKRAKSIAGYKDTPVTWAQEVSNPSSFSSPISTLDSRETKVIPRGGDERKVPPPPGMRPPAYGNKSAAPPNPYRPGPYGATPLPFENNTFTGAYYRGSSVVYPNQIKERTIRRITKDQTRRSQVQVKVEKDNSQRKADAAIISQKSTGNVYTRFYTYIFNWRFPYTQITLGFMLTVLIYLGINIGVFFLYADAYYSFGSLTAGNGLLVALPASRNGLVNWLLGVPFDRTVLYHRWLGRFTIFLGLIHWILSWVYYAQQNGGSLMAGLQQISFTQSNNFGYVSFAAMIVIFFTSLELVRRRQYEVFFYLHFFFVLFYLFGALHSTEMANYCIAGVIIYFLDRIIRIIWGAFPTKTLKVNYKEGDLVQIVFSKHYMARWLKLHRVGQYMFINFPTLSALEWHPFSISSGPDEKTVEIHIKGLGDHTRKIVAAAKERAALWIRSDGPYGNLKLNYRRFPVFFLAAGGIGVTPVIGILKDIYRYGELDTMARTRHKSLVEKVYFIWTIQNTQQYAWFSEEIKYFLDASKKGNSLPDLEVHVFVTKGELPSSSNPLQGQFHQGRPDFSGIFNKLVHDFSGKASIVFTCGPRRLVNDCWDSVSDQQRDGAVIHFHHETFEF